MEREGSERAVGEALAHALLENVLLAVDEQADSFPSLMVWNLCCCNHDSGAVCLLTIAFY